MNIVKLTEYIVKNLVKEPENVSIKEFQGDDEETVIQVLVSNNDMAALIGKSGSTINAVRTIVQAVAYTNQLPKVKIYIDSY